jgi:hypothetical protein
MTKVTFTTNESNNENQENPQLPTKQESVGSKKVGKNNVVQTKNKPKPKLLQKPKKKS